MSFAYSMVSWHAHKSIYIYIYKCAHNKCLLSSILFAFVLFIYIFVCLFIRSFVCFTLSICFFPSFFVCLCFSYLHFAFIFTILFYSGFCRLSLIFSYFFIFGFLHVIYIYSILVDMNLLVKVDFMDQVGHVLLVVKLKQHNHLKNHLVSQCLP